MNKNETVRTIDHLTRLNNSVNGNPRFRVTFTDGSSAITQSDAAFCYGLENPEFRDRPVIVSFSRAGRITHVRSVGDAE